MNAISSVVSVSTGADVDVPFGADVEASCAGAVVVGVSGGADVDVSSARTLVVGGASVVAAATDVDVGGGEVAVGVEAASGAEVVRLTPPP